MLLVRILMLKSGFEDEVLIKLIVGVVKQHHDELGPVLIIIIVTVTKKLFSIYKVLLL
jgi:hypothetical protein